MSKILNITNGDSTVALMEKAGISGGYLPWRDVLHEGSVPANLSLEELSEIRAKYISDNGWGEIADIQTSFSERDDVIKSYKNFDKLILWFEHDLYDQLQILQILDFFYEKDLGLTELSLICTDQYLGMLQPDEFPLLFKYETQVTDIHLKLAHQAWSAFRESTPESWSKLLDIDTSALEFLKSGVIRMIQEFPSQKNGLSRTEQQALTIISKGEKHPGKVFGKNQQLEESMFMGDSSFWHILYSFLNSSPPLLAIAKGKELTLPTKPDQELSITQAGNDVLSGQLDWTDINILDKWIGGTHLTQNNIWYWDSTDGIGIHK
ncbi:MAG: hypothetical protein HQL46_00855 [Gammaproteobacteria bacterium]|nr:hypothetical protein [Gammaproteobacteria bacterium]